MEMRRVDRLNPPVSVQYFFNVSVTSCFQIPYGTAGVIISQEMPWSNIADYQDCATLDSNDGAISTTFSAV